DKGKPPAKVGRKAVGPSGIARLPKGLVHPGTEPAPRRRPASREARPPRPHGGSFRVVVLLSGLSERMCPMLKKFSQKVANFLKAEAGPTAVEYAVMLALIIVVCIAAISALGSNAANTFNYVGNKVNTTSSCAARLGRRRTTSLSAGRRSGAEERRVGTEGGARSLAQ